MNRPHGTIEVRDLLYAQDAAEGEAGEACCTPDCCSSGGSGSGCCAEGCCAAE